MGSTPDWSNIPLELAGLVLGRLEAHVDRVRFAAVCPQWRSAARQVKVPLPMPLLALKDGDAFYSMPRGEPLNFAGFKDAHLDGCRKGFYTACGSWLVYLRWRDLLLLDPFSGATMTLVGSLLWCRGGRNAAGGHAAGSLEPTASPLPLVSVQAAEAMASTPDWSNIPMELAGLVLGRLEAHVDRICFAAVCPQWRSTVRQVKVPPPMPLLALKDGDVFYSMPGGEPLNFAGFKDAHLDGCRKGFYTACGNWLVYQCIFDLLLLDPLSGATMTLPPPDHFVETGMSNEVYMDMRYSQVIKMMVCSPNLVAVLLNGKESNRVAVCRPGGSKWSIARKLSLWITDMAFYQGKLYVVDYHEDIFALDISVNGKGDPRVARIGRVFNVGHFDDQQTLLRMLYLVESCGSLLLVRRRIFSAHVHDDGQIHTFAGQCEPHLLIFEADFVRSQWAKVTTLADNQALFLGPCSRAVYLPQGDSPGNRVWFLDD